MKKDHFNTLVVLGIAFAFVIVIHDIVSSTEHMQPETSISIQDHTESNNVVTNDLNSRE